MAPPLGFRHNRESKLKMSASHLGKPRGENWVVPPGRPRRPAVMCLYHPERKSISGRLCSGCYQKHYHRALWGEVLEAYGKKCTCCSEGTQEFLTFEHVNGGGADHRRKRGYLGVLVDAKRQGWPDAYTILCMNCNWARGKYGRCPHQGPGPLRVINHRAGHPIKGV